VSDLKPGDMIDLQGDVIADPYRNDMRFEFEYALVGAIIVETPTCTVLCLDGIDHYGFHPCHLVRYAGHDDSYAPV
jgi:hypothetical protein